MPLIPRLVIFFPSIVYTARFLTTPNKKGTCRSPIRTIKGIIPNCGNRLLLCCLEPHQWQLLNCCSSLWSWVCFVRHILSCSRIHATHLVVHDAFYQSDHNSDSICLFQNLPHFFQWYFKFFFCCFIDYPKSFYCGPCMCNWVCVSLLSVLLSLCSPVGRFCRSRPSHLWPFSYCAVTVLSVPECFLVFAEGLARAPTAFGFCCSRQFFHGLR